MRPIDLRKALTVAVATVLFVLPPAASLAAAPPKPNFIVVFVDNFGNGDLGCFGSKLHRTPHVDRLAAEGRKFTSFYVSSGVCTPSRASLMTGCYPRRVNLHVSDKNTAVLQPVAPKGLNPSETTIAEVLKQAGYATACIGKWHLGDQPSLLPTRQGFDLFFGIPYSDDMTKDKRPDTWPELPLMRNEKVIEAPVDRDWLVKRCTEEAVAFIEQNKDRPFFLYLPHTMPGSTAHPFSSPAFRGKSKNGDYGDAVEELDWSTGQLMAALERFGLEKNTLVVWTSDNGAVRRNPPQGSCAPYRGYGYDTSEGAMRMPCVMRWPARIPAGTVCDELCSTMDLLPTFANLAGAPLPEATIDGHDIRPLLWEQPCAKSPWDDGGFLYYMMDQLQAVRSGAWKLYLPLENKYQSLGRKTAPARAELYDVRNDVGETREASADHPEVVQRLLGLADRAREELGDMDKPGKGQRPAAWVEDPKPLEPGRGSGVFFRVGPATLAYMDKAFPADTEKDSRPLHAGDSQVDADILLAGGTLYDGSGSQGVNGDLAIRDGKIVAVGEFETGRVGRRIDCAGLIVAPGFIDLHTHCDSVATTDKLRPNLNYLTQGCTTVVTGNCGGGAVNVAEYFEKIDRNGAGTNVIHLVPHGSVRAKAMGSENRAPTAEELQRMKDVVDRGMREGAWGMSTGLIYVPGMFAKSDEIIELAKVVAAHAGIYASHIRSEGSGLVDAVREAVEVGRAAGLPVHISHFKATGKANWHLIHDAIHTIEEARAGGLTVTADQYPYVATSTGIGPTLFPATEIPGGLKDFARRIQDDPEFAREVRQLVQRRLGDSARIVIAACRKHPEWVGKSLEEIAGLLNVDAVEAAIRIQADGGASVVKFSLSEDGVRHVMGIPWVATGSDGSSAVPSDGVRPHPRSFGTFPRKIGYYAIRENVIPLAAAIRSATGLPADILKLPGRGYLRPDYVADVVAFDPKRFVDLATFDDPQHYSTGVRYIFVAGQAAIDEGSAAKELYGLAIRHSE